VRGRIRGSHTIRSNNTSRLLVYNSSIVRFVKAPTMETKYSGPLRGIHSAVRWLPRCNLGFLRLASILLLASSVLGNAFATEEQPAAVPFVALHVYYISPTGKDQNTGTSPSTAWATPHHNVKCGDVIIAEPGTYVLGTYVTQFGENNWGTVSNCPSTSGGIDGAGGIYFAIVLCGGTYLGACMVSGAPDINNLTVNNEAFRVDKSNWAVEGFVTTQSDRARTGCMLAVSESSTNIAFVAFINNIASTCGVEGFGTVPGPGGVDQSAVVGAIAYNASPSLDNSAICGSGVSMIPTAGTINTSGTHIFVAGAFAYKNINAPSGAACNTDGEGIIFDSWSCSSGGPYPYQGVVEQSVMWMNGNSGFAVFPNCSKNGDNAQVYVFNNTSYGNEQDPKHEIAGIDGLLNQVSPSSGGGYYAVFNNIFQTTQATSGNNGRTPVYAAGVNLNNLNTNLVAIKGNYFWQSNPGSKTTAGNPNTDVWVNGNHNVISFPFGTNTYNNPGFANPNGLPTSPPNCTGFTNTTACMNQGYQVAANLRPSAALGIGYQPPGPCRPDPYFPVWLKGVVFLQWKGSNLTENPGLISKPCDM
jgi:hypothetical protein